MSTFVIEKWHEDLRCTIYSVRQDIDDEDSYTEADKFFEKYGQSEDTTIKEAAQLLLQFVINEISKVHGAKVELFNRNEARAQALPYVVDRGSSKIFELNYFYKNFPLRLYCYRISDNILVLFNGGIKSSDKAQDSPDVSMKFHEAQGYASKIESAIIDKIITIEESKIIFDDDTIILY